MCSKRSRYSPLGVAAGMLNFYLLSFMSHMYFYSADLASPGYVPNSLILNQSPLPLCAETGVPGGA